MKNVRVKKDDRRLSSITIFTRTTQPPSRLTQALLSRNIKPGSASFGGPPMSGFFFISKFLPTARIKAEHPIDTDRIPEIERLHERRRLPQHTNIAIVSRATTSHNLIQQSLSWALFAFNHARKPEGRQPPGTSFTRLSTMKTQMGTWWSILPFRHSFTWGQNSGMSNFLPATCLYDFDEIVREA